MTSGEPTLSAPKPRTGVAHPAARSARLAASFCGWAGLAEPPEAARNAVSRLRESTHALVDTGIWARASHFGLAAAGSDVESIQDEGASVMLAGRPRWRGKDGFDSHELAFRVLDGYRRSGPRVLESLGGAFALVLSDAEGRESLLAVDRIGIAPLVYAHAGDGVVFGSSVQWVAACRDETPGIDVQSVFNYLFLHCVPGPTTIVADVRRMLPGSYLHIRGGRVECDRYWKPRYNEASTYDSAELEGEFRHLLEQAVERALSSGVPGAFLSGGTDSSTVAGMLTRLRGKGARTYSIGFEAAGYDEMSYARIAARHFATSHHEYYVTPDDVLAVAKEVASFCDQPFGNASAVPAYYCAKLAAADGVDLLLAGDGGDELFGGNERYAMQAIYGLYDALPAFMRKRVIEPVLVAFPGGQRVTMIRKGRGFIAHTAMPVPMRVYAHNMVHRNGPSAVFTPEFLARVDSTGPEKLFCAVYDSADAQSVVNRMLAVDLKFTLADNDLYKVGRMCDLAGVEVAYPMLDDDLVEFSTRLPSRLKLKGRQLRYFFKKALRDFLPSEIIAKRKHGFGLPVGIWMHSHPRLREWSYEAVRNLGRRGVVRPEFVNRMIAGHHADDAAYWGNELWVMSQLELWLQQHGWPSGQALL
jgi:asparagine synthase (glutamine-hydrolysing)